MATIKKNYKSDFDAILHLVSCVGDTKKEIGWPDYVWVARFYTTSHDNVYIASNIGGVLTNCFNDNGNIHVVFNNHGLPSGTLRVEFSAEIPNSIYPDGSQLEVSPQPLDIELVRGRGDCGTIVDVDVMLSYIKGDKGDKGDAFTYDDFTPQQIAELKKPATDAASQLQEFQATAEANEADREENEDKRVQAETARAEEFATWEDEIDSKADRSELSNVLAEEPLTPGNFPDINTYTREELKMDLFVDMWNQAWGQYGRYDPVNAPDAEHPFMGNDIWMTYEEAQRVWLYRAVWPYVPNYHSANIPTNIPFVNGSGQSPVYSQYCATVGNLLCGSGIKIWNIGGTIIYPRVFPSSINFESWNPLQKIIGVFSIIGGKCNIPWDTTQIEDFRWKGISQNTSLFHYAPNLTCASVAFAVSAATTTPKSATSQSKTPTRGKKSPWPTYRHIPRRSTTRKSRNLSAKDTPQMKNLHCSARCSTQ